MKTLILVRHAHARSAGPAQPDHDRPLDERGRRDAASMGRQLARRGVRPGLIVSSPALRALTTAQLLADEIGHAREHVVVDERLYASSASRLLAIVRSLDDTVEHVMLFGHNPEFTELAHRLSRQITDMPTCAVAEFGFDTPAWSDVGVVEPLSATLELPQG